VKLPSSSSTLPQSALYSPEVLQTISLQRFEGHAHDIGVHEIDDQELGTWSVVASASFSSLVAVWLASFFDLKSCLCGKPITK
jgi:hypothetical protein